MSTKVQVLRPDLYKLEDISPATLLSAGLDLKLTRDVKTSMELSKEGKGYPYNDLVGVGLAVAIPPGHVGLLFPRSSAGHKKGFALGNTVGVIDSDYRGEIKLSIPAGKAVDMYAGTPVAQLVVVPVDAQFVVVEELDSTARGDGGFGSTDEGFVPDWEAVEEFNDKVATLLQPDEQDELAVECPYCAWTGHAHELDGPNGDLCPECYAIIKVPGVNDEE